MAAQKQDLQAFDIGSRINTFHGLDWFELCKAIMLEVSSIKEANKTAGGNRQLQRKYVSSLRWLYATLRDEAPAKDIPLETRQLFDPILKGLEKRGQFIARPAS